MDTPNAPNEHSVKNSPNHPGPPTPSKHAATETPDVRLLTLSEAVQSGGERRSTKMTPSLVAVSEGVRKPKPKPSTKPIPMSG